VTRDSWLRRAAGAFEAEDDPLEPRYDPAHLGAALVLALTAIGALYWILWTLLVFEGGLVSKLGPALQVLLRLKTAAEFGYRGPWDRGVFEGWAGNLGALLLAAIVISALHRLYWDAARRARERR
jgi:hypothetical protein